MSILHELQVSDYSLQNLHSCSSKTVLIEGYLTISRGRRGDYKPSEVNFGL